MLETLQNKMESFASIDSFLSKQESGSDAFGAVSSGSRRSLGSESSVISQIKDRVKQRVKHIVTS